MKFKPEDKVYVITHNDYIQIPFSNYIRHLKDKQCVIDGIDANGDIWLNVPGFGCRAWYVKSFMLRRVEVKSNKPNWF